nr:MerR family transcriptional regulator [uncultured Desulfobacter sp.]
MTRSTLLTIEDLTNKLDIGKATLKFMLHRFSPWLATQIANNETLYTEHAVTTLLKIQKLLDAGMLPEQVEDSLAQEAQIRNAAANKPVGNQGALALDMESVSMFKDMFQVYIEKQDRIACAQEALARVEERKADAMEKRTAAEEKKADAMTNIAMALQEMNRRVSSVPQAMEIAGRAVENIALEELEVSPGLDESLLDSDFDDNEHLFEDPGSIEDPFKDQGHEGLGDFGVPNLDDLTLLVDETALTHGDIDDLSSLIDSVSDPAGDLGDLSSLLEETPPEPEMDPPPHDLDDLSKLVDSDLSSSEILGQDTGHQTDHTNGNEDDIDDLFNLVGVDSSVPKKLNEDIDDLSKLIETESDEHTDTLDDLSALIETPEQSQDTMDDLSMLLGIGDTGEESGRKIPDMEDTQVDDLWSLVPEEPQLTQKDQGRDQQALDAPEEMDDLSALVNQVPNDTHTSADTTPDDQANIDDATDVPDGMPSIKPNISPDQDMKKYKATVMKIIIELKEQGSTPQQTTDRLNQDDVATLSGKPAWGLKAIEKIYGFIDSAK